MKYLRYTYILIFILFVSVLALSINNHVTPEVSYALRTDYSYLYKDGINMNIILYSNISNPRFSYMSRNKYYLCDLDEDFIIPINPLYIDVDKLDDMYLFNFTAPLPNFNELSIDNLYFKASNDYSEDVFNIGSLNVLEDKYESSISYLSLNKEMKDNNLITQIDIMLENDYEINEIIMSKSLDYTYEEFNKHIIIYLNTNNYIKDLYAVIKCNEGIIKIDNFTFNNSKISAHSNEHLLSVMKREAYND